MVTSYILSFKMTSCAEGDRRANEKCFQEPRPIARFCVGRGGGGGGGGGANHDQNLKNVMIAVLYPFDSSSEFSRGF